jgi:hypothetical protein
VLIVRITLVLSYNFSLSCNDLFLCSAASCGGIEDPNWANYVLTFHGIERHSTPTIFLARQDLSSSGSSGTSWSRTST